FSPIVITGNKDGLGLGILDPTHLHLEDGLSFFPAGRSFGRHPAGINVVSQKYDGRWIWRLRDPIPKEGSHRGIVEGFTRIADKEKRVLYLRMGEHRTCYRQRRYDCE